MTVVVTLTIVGVVGAALGLDEDEGTGGIVWEFVSTATTGLTVFLIAPLLFNRLRLTNVSQTDRSTLTTAD